MDANCISYKDTGYFSQTVIDYLDDAPTLRPFYSYRPTFDGFSQIIPNKKNTADTDLLINVLRKQYEQSGIKLPLQAGGLGFTVTTGHQLNIFAGPLYFIYKIVTAIKLARQLKERFPEHNFTPVYWMATEDHDFAEINYTKIGGLKVQWQLDAAGATGRLLTKTIRQALNQYKGVLGMEQHGPELAALVETAYTKFDKLADATRYLVHALFGQYGLVIVDADDIELKREFAPIIEQDIIQQNSFKNITATDKKLHDIGVHTQIHSREINFFYLTDNLRERLSFEDGRYVVLNTEISFSEEELKQEIKEHPERFSPNVAMRPLYQEVILPNIAYIGGGAEVVYWLQLKANFDHYGVDFPILLLRNSGLLIHKEQRAKITNLQFTPKDLFTGTESLKQRWVTDHSEHNLTLASEWQEMEALFEKIKQRAGKIDSTLVPSTSAVEARLKKAVDNLEKKLMRAEKRTYGTRLEQIEQIKTALFPGNSLQERTENFGLYYVKWGQQLIEELIRHFEPLDFEFCILSE
ncbi:bacillithiol biosynthesis cysteine-adding enzyme BshC [Mucilaginibacter yixingensis]|uniref:Putative cysteine ligase BshC n=1 Tax=Mucilaginibacter yixingensis TaxID=1295612 RepID=A0A2T5JF48_9SPHI|nr:bacillithiol biosynthesis cysteine-adding enzyme BshC [Mucilaginibacter yixingensis]PTR01051.1 bacillithiol biosynthesis cysteine-adding enzyme BshC [Mucilaginibacter yixingensis]